MSDIFAVDDKVFNDTYIIRRYVKNNRCVFGYTRAKNVAVNTTIYKDIKGFDINHDKEVTTITFKKSNGETFNVKLFKTVERIVLEKESSTILIKVL